MSEILSHEEIRRLTSGMRITIQEPLRGTDAALRLALDTATRERDEAREILRDIATYGWYAKGGKVARAYFAGREKK